MATLGNFLKQIRYTQISPVSPIHILQKLFPVPLGQRVHIGHRIPVLFGIDDHLASLTEFHHLAILPPGDKPLPVLP